METRPVFDNLSALDHRYFKANNALFELLVRYLSETASVNYCVRVETALLRAHLRRTRGDSPEALATLEKMQTAVTAEKVYAEENRTQHNIRALVRVMKEHLSPDVASLVHLGATSVDILDTAFSLRMRECMQAVVIPLAVQLETQLVRLAREHAGTLQIGRTHGQHGVPITFGFALSEYVSRFGNSVKLINERSLDLRGKISGAMGGYNSTSLITTEPELFEQEVLGHLGLRPADHATQMVQPEFMLRLLLELNTAFGIVANLADDLRNLQRTEINEVREGFSGDQVGSSTMPQKRNPWNAEHVKSLWKTFAPRVMTFFHDQISEHQRDLTNSASSRFIADYVAGFSAALNRMLRILEGLSVNVREMSANASLTGDLALAEAAYTLLASSGVSDAHEVIRLATLQSEEKGVGLVEVLKNDDASWSAIEQALRNVSNVDGTEFFSDPSRYTGQSAQIAARVCDKYESEMNDLMRGWES